MAKKKIGRPKKKAGEHVRYCMVPLLAEARPDLDTLTELVSEERDMPIPMGRVLAMLIRGALRRRKGKR